jgi:hypothetical protein
MKAFRTALSLSAACALALAVGVLAHPAGTHADAAPSATGAGHFQSGGALRTFSFEAHSTGPGTAATGQAQLNNRSLDTVDHIQIDCLAVFGNVADIGGTITSSNTPAFVGLHGVFSVIDNGQSNGSPEDQITLFFFPTAPGTCIANFTGFYINIDGGAVQVRG